MRIWTRRDLIRLVLSMPGLASFSSYRALAAVQNFYRSESALGWPGHYIEGMAAGNPPEVRKGQLKVPSGPGLGLDIDPDFLHRNLANGEEFWS